jgi:hypothetical protein
MATVNDFFLPEVPYKAFSGANIYATIGHKRIGSLQSLTVSITREVAALYSFADANPKAFVKGKRGIGGTLVFTQFDRHAVLEDVFAGSNGARLRDNSGFFLSRFANNSTALLNDPLAPSSNFDHNIARGIRTGTSVSEIGQDIQAELETVYEMVANQQTQYVDQLPPFDITVTMVNEQGDAAFFAIGGVQLINEGYGYTLDDLTSESAFTYVARAVTPLRSLTQQQNRNTRFNTRY